MSEHDRRRALSFGGVAETYHRGRPSYPDDAVRWLLSASPDGEPLTVLELGAGTGKLTASLVAHGHEVYATEPDEAMLEVLRRHLPDVPTSVAGAEELPLPDQSVDVVVAAQCLHWVDPARALPEIARVLRPGGHLAAAWNVRDERIPWVRRLGRIIDTQEDNTHAIGSVETSEDFHGVDEATFKQWQVVDRRSIQDLALSRSNIAVRSDSERERVLAELLALYDDYGRGMDGMQLPYQTRCFRARVVDRPPPAPEPTPDRSATDDVPGAPLFEPTVPISLAGDDPFRDSADSLPRVATGDDTGMLLIDLR